MDPETIKAIDVISKVLGAFGILMTAYGLHRSWRIRQDDLQWRKASAARDALLDIHRSPYATEAIHIIDSQTWREDYTAPSSMGSLGAFAESDVETALSTEPLSSHDKLSPAQLAYLRRCFDWLLYYFDRVGYLEKERMLTDKDFAAPLKPYAIFITTHWKYFAPIVDRENYVAVRTLLAKLAKVTPEALDTRTEGTGVTNELRTPP